MVDERPSSNFQIQHRSAEAAGRLTREDRSMMALHQEEEAAVSDYSKDSRPDEDNQGRRKMGRQPVRYDRSEYH